MSLILAWGSLAYGQQQTPVSAADDSLTTTGEEVKQTTNTAGPTSMQPDSVAATRKVRRGADKMMYYFSLGIGGAYNYLPDSFNESYSPSFGLRLGGGVSRYNLRLGVIASYNFFLSTGPTTIYPNDLNILTLFAEVKYIPVGKTVRPYVVVCGGLYRQWIVNEDYMENVLGYGGGAGIELMIDKTKRLYIEGRYVQGQTRETERKANTEIIPFGIGVAWVF